ncbi:Tox-REase-5 domain-containing protein [Streptomyces tropicalis]|uniref:Tox-REase-5 domain-containing protein n=1 Tax=Streptomyces tropicalis TaxID=3034234 RepID=A0ABT6A0G0_9ACTN|nr:Tox-REase-5 domain-containing protein [Streptomyces tropicalis]MDF3298134.1 Tox-REase-5 domain-containing protein [Streptomyces tropicalis]
MAWDGGAAGSVTGIGTAGGGGRRDMPAPVATALVLLHVLFAVTVVGGVGLLLTAASHDAVDGGLIALVAYAAAPGALGWWLARRTWAGGTRVRYALLAVQAWLILGGLANLAAGSARGGVQLFLPVLVVYFLLRPESRMWYRLPVLDRAERRPFSLARMIRWRRGDEGQTAVEYLGLVAVVVALVTALVVSGLGTRIYGGIEAQVCKVSGMGCPAPAGGGTGTTAGRDPGRDGTSTGDGNSPQSDGTTTDDGRSGGDSGGADGGGDPKDSGGGRKDDGGKKDDGCFSGVGAFFGCAGHQIKEVGQGLFVDGVWGDVKGIWGIVSHPLDTLKGIGDYGKQLGEDWWNNSKGARDKWADGDYFGAIWDWGGASLNTGGTVLYDLFVGDDVADAWNKGDKTRAVTHVLWNIGSLLIPGYDGAKIVEKVGDLGRLSKLAKLGKLAEEAGKAAEDARKAAKAGDVEGAEKAAERADEAADAAERKARQSGCTVSAPARPVPYGDGPRPGAPAGSAGTGTTVLAAAEGTPYVVLADDGCDGKAKKEAAEARKQADEADKAAEDARKKGRKEWPDPKPGDKNDPRNYNPPDWAKDLKDPRIGDADKGDGKWASRDRNPEPTWQNEAWLRYQEQVTGVNRGKEYVVPRGEGKRPVEFDGWDGDRQTFLEAKLGYKSYLGKDGELTRSGREKFVKEARGQVEAAGGRTIEWHFSDENVADAARKAFRREGLTNVKVVYDRARQPISGPMKK